MSVHRTRFRQQSARSTKKDPGAADRQAERQVEVEQLAAELLVLWRALPHALARDSAGLLNDDRHATGASTGSPSPANTIVIDAAVLIETGLLEVEAEAVALLRLERRNRPTAELIGELPDWYRNLTNTGQPLARHMFRDLKSWVRDARGAIGTRRMDRKLGPLCPDHRDTKPAPLLEVGLVAEMATSLRAGPPPIRYLAGPTCGRGVHVQCDHGSCRIIRAGRIVDEHGKPTDWVHSPAGGLAWSSADESPAFTWNEAKRRSIRCPECGTQWTSTTERRVLARRLAELGDARPDAAALVT